MQNGHGRNIEAAAGRAVAAWFRLVGRAPRLVLAIVGLLLLISAFAASGIKVDTDSSRMLSSDLPFQARAHALAEAFPATKNTVVAVIRSPHADAADAATLALSQALGQRANEIGDVFAPAADPFLVSHGLLYDDLDALDSRLTRLSQASNLIAALRADQSVAGFFAALDEAVTLASRAAIDPSSLAPFLAEATAVLNAERAGSLRPLDWQSAFTDEPSAEPVIRMVTVEPKLDYTRLSPAKPAIEAVRETVDALDPGLKALVDIGITGDPVLRAEELESVTARLGASLALSVLLVAGVLFLAVGRAARVALALGTVAVTLILTAGFAAVAVGALNLISIAFVVLMVGLGIDFAIHLMTHLDEDASHGLSAAGALDHSSREIGGALALSALTTAMAFFAFTGTDFVGMAQLGVIGGAGVIIALFAALTVVPAAVAIRPSLARGRGRLPLPVLPLWAMRALAFLALGAGLAAGLLAPQARFDADPMALRDPAAPSVVVYHWLVDDPALAPLRLGLIADTPEAAREAAAALEPLPEVRTVVWLDDLVPKQQAAKLELIDLAWPSLQFAVEGDPLALTVPSPGALSTRLAGLGTREGRALAVALDAWDARATPERDAALGEALFRFFPLLLDRLAAQLEVDEFGVDDLPTALIDRFRAPDGRLRVDIAPEGNMTDPVARAAFVAAVAAVAPEAGGPPAQIEGAARAVGNAMLEAATLALSGTLLLAVLMLRRVRLVAAIVVPLILAGSITLAASVLFGLPFNYANVIVLPLMIGVGVDAGIHLALRTESSGIVSGTSTPRAVLASALTTIAAFGTLALSDHRGTASMGLMLTIAMAVSVAMIFALTPWIVRLGRR
ncbi:MMPL family transporter [Limibaculum sp. M0105]|uniref:MMPL family transporter n=1 Tax=Thermohalobaculum xanthum TaxID=2753746 RepID=A0A8J7SE79_9RHOB|nr:MMPL family transporter [Thermohalobaculum xanthum]MBK0397730.1 MMPL family transporter [Thermohalobaculum xanthum]